jgi:catechol 2,3-dioxygenase
MSSPISMRDRSKTRLPADAGIGRVRLRVADLERSLGFYRDVLGLNLIREQGGEVALAGGGRELIVLEEHSGIARRPRRPRTTGLYHVALLLPSRTELGRTLLGLDAARYELRGMSDHAVSESLYLDDPDGNGLEIYADRPRHQWPVEAGIVQMTVEPMDIEGVLAAAKENPTPWSGVPPETVIGHVHLTVSRMDPAVVFYRDVVGFDDMMRIPSLAAVSAGGYHHHLNLNTWAGEGAPRDTADVAGLEAWELRVPQEPDRIALLQRLGAAGALTNSSANAIALDPDGNRMEVFEG